MEFSKHTWQNGEVIDADKLNHIEAGILEALNAILQCLKTSGGELSGELIVNENFQVRKSFDDIPYRSYLRPANYALGDEYTTALIHYVNGVNNAQLIFNRSGVLLRDNVAGKASNIYGQHNIETLRSESLNRTTKVNAHDTNYTTLMARGTSLNSAETNPTANGTIAWTYK